MNAGALALVLAGAAGPALAQPAPDGAAIFARVCAACHQADASGTVGLAPALKGEHWQRLGASRTYLPAVMVHGLAGAIKVNGATFIAGNMPSFTPMLDDAAMAAVATHLRKLQGAEEPAYTAEEFKAARERPGSPPQTRQLRAQLLGP
jgi:mono/diheme cytochrome c family protein